jgi:DNA-binding NarL/FixJ family response regulator
MKPKDRFPALTRRQAEIQDLRQAGTSIEGIAFVMGIEPKTVQNVGYTIDKKLKAMKITVAQWEE